MQAKAAEIAPDDHRVWGRLADALRFLDGEGERAFEVYDRAANLARKLLEVNNNDWRTLGQLSIYLAYSGKPEEAMATAQRAMDLSRRNAESLFYAAIVSISGAQTDACLTLLEEAVANDPSYRNLIAIDPDLKQLSELPRFQVIIAEP